MQCLYLHGEINEKVPLLPKITQHALIKNKKVDRLPLESNRPGISSVNIAFRIISSAIFANTARDSAGVLAAGKWRLRILAQSTQNTSLL